MLVSQRAVVHVNNHIPMLAPPSKITLFLSIPLFDVEV